MSFIGQEKETAPGIEKFTERHYPLVCAWWKEQKWAVVPMRCLPKTGLVVNGCCAGFLYKTDSDIAIMDFIIADPRSDKAFRDSSLDTLITELVAEAKASGYAYAFSFSENASFISRCEKHKFKAASTGMTNLIRGL